MNLQSLKIKSFVFVIITGPLQRYSLLSQTKANNVHKIHMPIMKPKTDISISIFQPNSPSGQGFVFERSCNRQKSGGVYIGDK